MVLQKLENVFLYIPKFNGNKKLNGTEQISLRIKRPTVAELESMKYWQIDIAGNRRLVIDYKKALTHIESINNLYIDKTPITKDNIDELYGKNLDLLIDEIVGVICDINSMGE